MRRACSTVAVIATLAVAAAPAVAATLTSAQVDLIVSRYIRFGTVVQDATTALGKCASNDEAAIVRCLRPAIRRVDVQGRRTIAVVESVAPKLPSGSCHTAVTALRAPTLRVRKDFLLAFQALKVSDLARIRRAANDIAPASDAVDAALKRVVAVCV